MTRYAEKTSVNSMTTRQDIERVLSRYGADQFIYAWDQSDAVVAFRMNGRQIKFTLPLPDKTDRSITHTPSTKVWRSPTGIAEAYEQAIRSRWRALYLVIKAKLEAVESGITEFEDEFLAHIVLPNGATFGTWARPQIAHAYETATMPTLMPGGSK